MEKPRRGIILVAIATMIAAGIAFRLWGLFTDFWLDEIWALRLAQNLKSPVGIFTSIHFDTNHWLYTFLMWLCGDQPAWMIYRIPSFAAGVFTLLLAPVMLWEKGLVTRVAAVFLFSFSFCLIFYSSEARGYALVILFSLLAFHFLGRFLASPRKYLVPLFWLSCILGFLSHLTYVFVWVALFAWSVLSLSKKDSVPKTAAGLLKLHAVPGLLFLALYFVDIRKIQHGGGDIQSLSSALGQVAGWLTGMPASQPFGIVGILLCCAIAGTEIIHLKRAHSDVWFFYLVVLVAGPAISIASSIWTGFHYWVPRHFIASVPFYLLVLSGFIGRHLGERFDAVGNRLSNQPTGNPDSPSLHREEISDEKSKTPGWRLGGSLFCAVILLTYATGNLARVRHFIEYGRGHYLEAVKYMAHESREPTFSVGSDHDFRNETLLLYYARYLPANRRLIYCHHAHWPPAGPDWVITHYTETDHKPEQFIHAPSGSDYQLARAFLYSGLSGWNWYLYRNVNSGIAAPSLRGSDAP